MPNGPRSAITFPSATYLTPEPHEVAPSTRANEARYLTTLRLVRTEAFTTPAAATTTEARPILQGAKGAAEFMRPYAARELGETAWILLLDVEGRVIGDAPVAISRGTLDHTIANPRDVFRPAIAANAAGVVFVHNHPGATAKPSPDDIQTSRMVKLAGEVVGIPLLDSIIVASDSDAFHSLGHAGELNAPPAGLAHLTAGFDDPIAALMRAMGATVGDVKGIGKKPRAAR